jgi:hypothetical protein
VVLHLSKLKRSKKNSQIQSYKGHPCCYGAKSRSCNAVYAVGHRPWLDETPRKVSKTMKVLALVCVALALPSSYDYAEYTDRVPQAQELRRFRNIGRAVSAGRNFVNRNPILRQAAGAAFSAAQRTRWGQQAGQALRVGRALRAGNIRGGLQAGAQLASAFGGPRAAGVANALGAAEALAPPPMYQDEQEYAPSEDYEQYEEVDQEYEPEEEQAYYDYAEDEQ